LAGLSIPICGLPEEGVPCLRVARPVGLVGGLPLPVGFVDHLLSRLHALAPWVALVSSTDSFIVTGHLPKINTLPGNFRRIFSGLPLSLDPW
jgi:hypothetical protein